MQAESIAEMVVQTIKNALAPISERLAVAEARLAAIPAHEKSIGELRDRVVAADAVAGVRQAPVVDLSPVTDRLAAAEAQIAKALADVAALPDLRDRLVATETKCSGLLAMPAPDASVERRLFEALDKLSSLEYAMNRAAEHETMIADLKARLAVAEALSAQYASLAADAREMAEKLAVLEAKAASPTGPDPLVQSLNGRMATIEQRVIDDPAMKACSALGERVAVVEMRAQVPGPAGPAGNNGKDGVDGLGFDDIAAVQEDERTVVFKATRGDRVKEIGRMSVPVALYRGVYQAGKSYVPGDVVTWGGSSWHCGQETTEKPGDGAPHWKLMVKRGSDGKDARDGVPAALPVVTSTGRRA